MTYLHGIEIKETPKQVVLTTGDTAIIGLVGTASQGEVNKPVLITSLDAGVAAFGEDIGGFTIPSALAAIFNIVSAKVVVVNVLANADAEALISEIGDPAIWEMTTDVDGYWATGIGKADLPETTDYESNIIAGINKLLLVEDTLGIKPNIVIAPGYSQLAAVLAQMESVAVKLNGVAAVDIDSEVGTVAAALAARASGNYAISSPAVVICFPRAIRYNAYQSENQPIALSVYWAIAKVLRDATKGYWYSPSNTEFVSILGTEVDIRSSLTDPAADTNLLNGQGIVTLFRKAGSGRRIWGNWTAAFPTESSMEVMIAPRAVRMAIREALIDASINFLDVTNITRVGIDMVLNSVNGFLRTLTGKGVLNPGSECSFSSDKNPSSEVVQGKLTFTLTEVFAPSLDKMTFEEVIDLEALNF